VSKDDQFEDSPRSGAPGDSAGHGHASSGPNLDGTGDSEEQLRSPQGAPARVPDAPPGALGFPQQTPLFHAQNAERYARQTLIRQYEQRFGCRLIVMMDAIFPWGVTLLEELIAGADPSEDLHLILDSPGGDGETAVRLVRSAQSRCRQLTVIVPNQAKSAGTILAMGAHCILMGPTSDLGPVDPQFQSPNGPGLYSAKDLIAAVENAEKAIGESPETYPLHVSMLADVTALMVQQARSALERTGDLVREALKSQPDRSADQVDAIALGLKEKLIDLPWDHGAVFDAIDARNAGLPVVIADPDSDQWRIIWQLWTKYFTLGAAVYEGRLASQVIHRGG
jgi:hypothetical protein